MQHCPGICGSEYTDRVSDFLKQLPTIGNNLALHLRDSHGDVMTFVDHLECLQLALSNPFFLNLRPCDELILFVPPDHRIITSNRCSKNNSGDVAEVSLCSPSSAVTFGTAQF